MKVNDELDKENGKHYSIFSRNEQSKIDLSIEALQDYNADLKVEHYSLLMYTLVVGDAIRYIALLHTFLDEGTLSTFYTRRVRRQYLLVVHTRRLDFG